MNVPEESALWELKGEIKGDMDAGKIEVIDFVSNTHETIQLHTLAKGHNGSDVSMMRDFVRMIGEGKKGKTDACGFRRKPSDGSGSRGSKNKWTGYRF